MKSKLSEIYWPLRLAYGLVPLLTGLDKYVGILADWQGYYFGLNRRAEVISL
jgi:hypothetical protein